jgi:hypothetical protein
MKRQLPAAVHRIAKIVFVVSVVLIILGAYFDTFVNHPNLSVISVVVIGLSIVSRAYLQNA